MPKLQPLKHALCANRKTLAFAQNQRPKSGAKIRVSGFSGFSASMAASGTGGVAIASGPGPGPLLNVSNSLKPAPGTYTLPPPPAIHSADKENYNFDPNSHKHGFNVGSAPQVPKKQTGKNRKP